MTDRFWIASEKWVHQDLAAGACVSLALHALLFLGGWRLVQPAQFDVARDVSSLEVELFTLEPPIPMQAIQPAPVLEPESWQTIELNRPRAELAQPERAGHGAFTEAKPHGAQNPPPRYPWIARVNGWEGTVMLRVTVGEDGTPSEVSVARSSGYPVLDAAAQIAIVQWKFLPATERGQAVRSSVELPVRFRLTSSEGVTR